MTEYAISNKKNYLNTLNVSYTICFKTYKKLIYMFLKHYNDLFEDKNIQYDSDILITGLYALNNIFCFLLLKTKNIMLASQNSEKTIFYFFEFVEQMKKPKTDIQSILKLGVSDAKIFIYKKTIYDLHEVDNKLSKEDNTFFYHLKDLTNIYKTTIAQLLQNNTIYDIMQNINNINNAITYEEYMKTKLVDLQKITSANVENVSAVLQIN